MKFSTAVVAAVLVAGCAADPDGEAPGTTTSSGSTATTSAAPSPSETFPGVADIRWAPGSTPVGLAVDEHDRLWAAVARDDAIVERDAVTGESDHRVDDLPLVLRLAIDGPSLWATAFGSGELVEIDLATEQEVRRIAVGAEAEGLAVGFGSVWVILQADGVLARVDPEAGAVQATWPVGQAPRLVTAGASAVFASSYYGGTVTRVDPATGTATTSARLCGGPHEMLELAGSLWVACTTTGEVVRIDPVTLAEEARLEVASADALAAAPDGELLVGTQDGPSIAVVDPQTNTATRTVLAGAGRRVSGANVDLATDADGVWVSDPSQNEILHVAWADLVD